MRHKTLKNLALTSAVSLGLFASANVFAQVEVVNSTLTLSSAITSAYVSDMDFGTWLVQMSAAELADDGITLTLSNDGTLACVAGDNDNSSQIAQVTAPATEGVVTVQTPAPSNLTMTRGTFSDFADANVALTTATFATASETDADYGNGDAETITVVAGATDETVTFGGIITLGQAGAPGAAPAEGVHTASFDVTFSY